MSSLPAVPAALFPLPTTGEAIDLAKPADVAAALRTLRDFKAGPLADAIRVLEGVLLEEGERQGTKTLRLGAHEAKLIEKNETAWDVEKLVAGLRRLGCPEDRLDALVTEEVSYKVNGSVARQLAGANERYARAIKRAKTVTPGYRYVSVS